jgi:ABC-type lipoprotein release transport system permease subunit
MNVALLALAGGAAALVPAARASRVSPVRALQAE